MAWGEIRRGLLLAWTLVSLTLAGHARAQDSARAPDTAGQTNAAAVASGDTVQDVIVTSQKRAERLQDVPLPITALTQGQIEDVGASRFEDYVRLVPGLSYDPSLPGNAHLSLRGIATSNLFQAQQGTVGIFIDELPTIEAYGSYSTPDLRLFDVNRIEVLRGPQGTLFGAGALSGAIRVITNQPNLTKYAGEFEGTLAGTHGGNETYAVNGMVNIPLIEDQLALRVVAYDHGDGGYIDNVTTRKDNTNDSRSTGFRAALTYRIDGDWKATASFVNQHDNSLDAPFSIYGQLGYEYDSHEPFTSSTRLYEGNVVVEGAVGDIGVFAATALGQKLDYLTIDYTKTIATLLRRVIPTPGEISSRSQEFTQEVRLSSPETDRFKWLLGFYYETSRHDADNFIQSAILAPLLRTSNLLTIIGSSPEAEVAGFGEGTYRITDALEATVGLRVFNDSFSLRGIVDGVLAGGGIARSSIDTNATDATPKFELSWRPERALLLYALASKGYRFGEANLDYPARFGVVPPTYKSDSLWNYEVGVKTSFLDQRITVDASLYDIEWSNIQVNLKNRLGLNYVTNAGDARSYGGELELQARPLSSLQTGVSLSLDHPTLTRDVPGLAQNTGAVGAHAGDRLPGSPDFTSAEFAQLNIDRIPDFPIYVRVDHQYVGRSYSDFSKATALRAGDYNVVNLRIGVVHGAYEFVAFVNNLGDSHGVVNTYPSASITYAAIRLRPQTIGVTARAKF